MKKIITIFSFLLCLILIFPSMSYGQYVVGNTVPNFSLYDVNGVQHSLYDYMGEVVLLNFYTTW